MKRLSILITVSYFRLQITGIGEEEEVYKAEIVIHVLGSIRGTRTPPEPFSEAMRSAEKVFIAFGVAKKIFSSAPPVPLMEMTRPHRALSLVLPWNCLLDPL